MMRYNGDMRSLIAFDMLSADGCFAGADGDISWHNVDEAFNDFAVQLLDAADTLLFGRKTYELMAAYWPTPQAAGDDPAVARRMNDLRKVVYTRSLQTLAWQHAELAGGDLTQTAKDLKNENGKDILLFGSGEIVAQLAAAGLIDEFRFMIAPVLVGDGRHLFAGLQQPFRLALARMQQFTSGNVLLCYRPA